MKTFGMSGKRSVREHVLGVLFTLSLAWSLLWFGMFLFGECAGTLNPAPEGSFLYSAVEYLVPVGGAVAIATIFSVLLIRRIPGFLGVPRQVTSRRLWCTLLMTLAVVGLGLLLGLIVATAILDPPGPNPENEQYISLVFWLPALVTVVMAPVVSVVIAWWWTVRKVSPPR